MGRIIIDGAILTPSEFESIYPTEEEQTTALKRVECAGECKDHLTRCAFNSPDVAFHFRHSSGVECSERSHEHDHTSFKREIDAMQTKMDFLSLDKPSYFLAKAYRVLSHLIGSDSSQNMRLLPLSIFQKLMDSSEKNHLWEHVSTTPKTATLLMAKAITFQRNQTGPNLIWIPHTKTVHDKTIKTLELHARGNTPGSRTLKVSNINPFEIKDSSFDQLLQDCRHYEITDDLFKQLGKFSWKNNPSRQKKQSTPSSPALNPSRPLTDGKKLKPK